MPALSGPVPRALGPRQTLTQHRLWVGLQCQGQAQGHLLLPRKGRASLCGQGGGEEALQGVPVCCPSRCVHSHTHCGWRHRPDAQRHVTKESGYWQGWVSGQGVPPAGHSPPPTPVLECSYCSGELGAHTFGFLQRVRELGLPRCQGLNCLSRCLCRSPVPQDAAVFEDRALQGVMEVKPTHLHLRGTHPMSWLIYKGRSGHRHPQRDERVRTQEGDSIYQPRREAQQNQPGPHQDLDASLQDISAV